jgi:hypothetical protein
MGDASSRLSYESDIRPLFRDKDRARMEFAFDLWDHADVKEHAPRILERLESGDMPCDAPWPDDQIDTFRRWMSSGMAP